MTLDGQNNLKLKRLFTYPRGDFLPALINKFAGNIPDPIYHSAPLRNLINPRLMPQRLGILELMVNFQEENTIESRFPELLRHLNLDDIVVDNVKSPEINYIFELVICDR
ncbi:MAG: hypothetical protein GF317_17350 [Candidatus Lokiarchaeota archaeon]|nr:hypothetical protein [Candidatus Lokiarchaeota archaeon]MBD3201286.1 hypothetical protein [Candidatus Lokiarchaeota archaeon]